MVMAMTPSTLLARLLLAACLVVGLTAQDAHDHEGHNHGHDERGLGYEWGGIFETPESTYVWTAQAVDGAYADPHMKMVVLPATAKTESELKSLETDVLHVFEGPCVEVEAGGTITPGKTCYDLHFNTSHTGLDVINYDGVPLKMCYDLDTYYIIATPNINHVAIFTEHVPTEFERSQHYLKDKAGRDIEPAAELTPERTKPWGVAIGAAVVVNLVTLIGLVLLIPGANAFVKKFPGPFDVVTNSFAAGSSPILTPALALGRAPDLCPSLQIPHNTWL